MATDPLPLFDRRPWRRKMVSGRRHFTLLTDRERVRRLSHQSRAEPELSPTVAEIGRRLREGRLERRLTQAEVAYAIGISQASLSNYERGRRDPRASVVIAIAKALHASIGELFDSHDTTEG